MNSPSYDFRRNSLASLTFPVQLLARFCFARVTKSRLLKDPGPASLYLVAQKVDSSCSAECVVQPGVGRIPWKREWQPTPVILLGEFYGQRSLAGYSPWGHKELDTTEQLSTRTHNKLIFLLTCCKQTTAHF